MPRKGKVALTQVAIILGLVLIWELGVRSGLIDPFFFPAPSAIVDRIMEWIATADFWTDLGITLLETLNILENFPLAKWGRTPDGVHVFSEAQKLAFRDRNAVIGDPSFVKTPMEKLLY